MGLERGAAAALRLDFARRLLTLVGVPVPRRRLIAGVRRPRLVRGEGGDRRVGVDGGDAAARLRDGLVAPKGRADGRRSTGCRGMIRAQRPAPVLVGACGRALAAQALDAVAVGRTTLPVAAAARRRGGGGPRSA